MKRNMKEWMYNLCNLADRSAMPLAAYTGAEKAGLTIIDIVKDGQAQYECMHAFYSMFPSAAAAAAVMDLSVEAEAFGSPVEFSKMDVPTVTGRIVHDRDSVDALVVPKVGDGRTGEYIKAVKLAQREIKELPVFGGIIGPYSLAGRLFDITEIMISSIVEPETVHGLLEKCTGFLTEYANAFKQAGANGIIIAEPAAGLLSPEQCQEFSSQYVKKVVDRVQDDYFIIILHNCGNVEKLVPSMISTGSKGLHFGNAVNMENIMPKIPWGRVAFGNIDPAGILKSGTTEKVREKTMELLEKTAVYKNFVLSSGCDVPPGTPIENIQAFFDALDEFNKTVILSKIA